MHHSSRQQYIVAPVAIILLSHQWLLAYQTASVGSAASCHIERDLFFQSNSILSTCDLKCAVDRGYMSVIYKLQLMLTSP